MLASRAAGGAWRQAYSPPEAALPGPGSLCAPAPPPPPPPRGGGGEGGVVLSG